MATKFVFKFENADVDASNYQICDFDVKHTGSSIAQAGAQMIAYFAAVGFATMGGVVKLIEVTHRAVGAAGATVLPFPTAEYAGVLAAATTDVISPAGMPSGYATQISAAGPLCPLGTSISVSEISAFAGRRGRGRHFLPYTGRNVVTTGGQVTLATRNRIEQLYTYFLAGFISTTGLPATAPVVGLTPVVTNAAGTPTHDIITVRAQPIFSNLESRRR